MTITLIFHFLLHDSPSAKRKDRRKILTQGGKYPSLEFFVLFHKVQKIPPLEGFFRLIALFCLFFPYLFWEEESKNIGDRSPFVREKRKLKKKTEEEKRRKERRTKKWQIRSPIDTCTCIFEEKDFVRKSMGYLS